MFEKTLFVAGPATQTFRKQSHARLKGYLRGDARVSGRNY